MRVLSKWPEVMGAQRTQFTHAFFGLFVFLVVLFLLISRGGSLAANTQTNLVARMVVRHAIGIEFSWTSLNWWTTQCRDSLDQKHSHETVSEQLIGNLPQPNIGVRIAALAQLLDGDCKGAIHTLELIERGRSDYSRTDLLLAHLYVMTAGWRKVPAVLPSNGLPSAPWIVRRFWANVYYRMGALPSLSHDDTSSAWVQVADRLSAPFLLDGSVDLADYLLDAARPVEAFDELRRAMVSMTTPSVLALRSRYVSLRQAALIENAQQYTSDTEAQRLYQKYSADPSQNRSDRPVVLSAAPIPEYPLHYKVTPGWELIGMDLDKDDLQMGPLVRTTFYWCQLLNSACLQYIAVSGVFHNLIDNSSFEWDPPISGIRPSGFLGGYYGEESPFPYDIITEGDNQAFCLINDLGHESAGITTPWRKLADEGSLRLVQGGSFRAAESGTAYIGWRWRSGVDQGFNHISTGESIDRWAARVGIVELPHQATEVAFHLLRYRSEGTACFDDLFAFSLPTPPEKPAEATP